MTRTAALSVKCEHCEKRFTLECEISAGFSYMPPGWFRCQSCGEINQLAALPGDPVKLTATAVR